MGGMAGLMGGGGGMPPGGGGDGMDIPQGNPMAGQALSALDQLSPKSPNPTAAMQKMEEALQLAYQLIQGVVSQASHMNPKVAKDGHQVSRTILNMKSELRKEAAPGPTPDLMMGMGMAGAPGPMSPGASGGPMGAG